MKKALIYIGLASVVMAETGCTKDFKDINTDPTRASSTTFDPNLLLPSIEWNFASTTTGYNGPILFQSMWVQILSSTSSLAANYYSNADKYVASSGTTGYVSSDWNNAYGAASFAYEMQNLTAGKDAFSNLNAAATITKIMCLQYVTDVYGDIPYTQALQAKSANLTLPVYDKQEDVYHSMLTELDAAITQLDPSKTKLTNDAFPYKGDITQWKKFGYSLMLKLAMRITNADAATAQQYAEKAAAGGTFASIADDAYIIGDNPDGYGNSNSSSLSTDVYEVRWSKTFIDYLKAHNDPRLGVIAEVPPAGLAGNNDATAAGDPTPGNQIGMPNGYDLFSDATNIANEPNYPGPNGGAGDVTPIGKYSRPRTSIYRNINAPIYILTYAETEMMLAEAASRGWNVGGTAASHYQNGVSAGIQSLKYLGTDATIPAGTADTYASSNPLTTASDDAARQQIAEQYWVIEGSYLNFVEAWSNWRRTGFPVLVPVNYTGNFSGGQIPTRQIYPPAESTQNPANYKAALGSLGGTDTWTGKVWWDQ